MTVDRSPRLASLAYHDYVALIAYLVEPLSVRIRDRAAGVPGDIHTHIRNEFAGSCTRYRDQVLRNAEGYFHANPPGVHVPGRPALTAGRRRARADARHHPLTA